MTKILNGDDAYVWGTNVSIARVCKRARRFFTTYTEPGADEPKYMAIIRQARGEADTLQHSHWRRARVRAHAAWPSCRVRHHFKACRNACAQLAEVGTEVMNLDCADLAQGDPVLYGQQLVRFPAEVIVLLDQEAHTIWAHFTGRVALDAGAAVHRAPS